MEVVLAHGGHATCASRNDIVGLADFQCTNRLASHPCAMPDIARVEGGQAAAMETFWVDQFHPEPAQGSYDSLALFGIEVIGHASGKECYPATRRSIVNDRSFSGQGLPAKNPGP